MSADWGPTVNPLDLVYTSPSAYSLECSDFANFTLVADSETSSAGMGGQWEHMLIAMDVGSGYPAGETHGHASPAEAGHQHGIVGVNEGLGAEVVSRTESQVLPQ